MYRCFGHAQTSTAEHGIGKYYYIVASLGVVVETCRCCFCLSEQVIAYDFFSAALTTRHPGRVYCAFMSVLSSFAFHIIILPHIFRNTKL